MWPNNQEAYLRIRKLKRLVGVMRPRGRHIKEERGDITSLLTVELEARNYC